MKERLSRREFLTGSGKAAAGLGIGIMTGDLLSAVPVNAADVRGANDKVVVGFIGCGNMGSTNLKGFLAREDVEIAAVCDVYEPYLNRAVETIGRKVDAYKDFRKVIERTDIDAVVVSTPDHWHAIPTVYACQAGKDVYVEKPLSHNIVEGRAMVRAAREHNRIVQLGTQQRSGTHFQRAVNIVKSGKIGKVTLARCWLVGNKFPDGVGREPDCAPPPDLDYDMWLGPAPKRPYNPKRCIYHFRWFWDYAGGQVTNFGVHFIDIIHWAMAVDAPLAVSTSGGKYAIDDMGETPDTVEAIFDYPGFTMVFSYRNCNARGMDGQGSGMQFHGTDGTLYVNRQGFKIYPEGDRMKDVEVELESGGSEQHGAHVANFIECVKSRNLPVSDVEIGHRSSSAPHLANIAYHTGRKIHWDAKRERIIDDKEASRLLGREHRKPWKL